jgi:hypothetical protein
MGTVLATDALTETYRVSQAKVSGEAGLLVGQAFRTLLDPSDLDRTFPLYASVAGRVISTRRVKAAGLGSAYYAAHRQASKVEAELPRLALASPASSVQLTTSLLVTGPVAVKQSLARGDSVETAFRKAETKTMGAAYRHVANAGRFTIHGSILRDSAAVGWARVSDGSPCAFCAMLVSRGPVYKSQASAGFGESGKYHDGCGCFVVPLYSSRSAWSGNAREYRDLWDDTGKKGGFSAFRKAYESKYATVDPAAEIAKAQAKRAAEEEILNLTDSVVRGRARIIRLP